MEETTAGSDAFAAYWPKGPVSFIIFSYTSETVGKKSAIKDGAAICLVAHIIKRTHHTNDCRTVWETKMLKMD